MEPQVWHWLRWLIALAVCAVVVVVSVPLAINSLTRSLVLGDAVGNGSDEEADGQAPSGSGDGQAQVPTGPVDDGDAPADTDFAVVDGVVAQSADSEIVISGGDSLVVAFPLIDGDPACVAGAELALQLEEADPTEVGVYAAALYAAPADGDEVGQVRRDDTVHAVALTDGTPGRLRWDVTDLYRAWASAELAPPGTSFTVVLVAHDAAATVTFASAESGEAGPSLEWEGQTDCGDQAA